MAYSVRPSTTLLLVIGLFAILVSSWNQAKLLAQDYDDAECGERKVVKQGLVKGGYQTRPGDWPWHAALYRRAEDRISFGYACGGTIVHRYLILTAAHCVTYESSRRKVPRTDLQIKLGRYDLSQEEEEYGETYGVRESIVHVGYVPTTFENDIAILRVAVPIFYSRFIQPVCLWKRDDGFVLPNVIGQAGTVVGWGLTDENRLATVLNEARMPVVDSLTCLASERSFFGGLLHAKAYCAGYKNGTGVCNGDSGGGMFFQFQNRWYLKGLVSFSNTFEETGRCNLQQYIGFTDASLYIDWLYENTPNSRGSDDPILGHPNIRLINQGDCGENGYDYGYQEERKPVIARYSWMVALRVPGQSFYYVSCNGVLINRNYILTTGCVDTLTNEDDELTVTIGDYDVTKTDDCDEDTVPRYCTGTLQTVGIESMVRKNNLVLARLTTPAAIGSKRKIQAICLPVTVEQRQRQYDRYILTGWKESGANAEFLQRAILTTIDHATCWKEFEDKFPLNSKICVRNPLNLTKCDDCIRHSACNDYQPGSIIQQIDRDTNRYMLYGVQSSLNYCSHPEIFVAVADYLEWILDNIRI